MYVFKYSLKKQKLQNILGTYLASNRQHFSICAMCTKPSFSGDISVKHTKFRIKTHDLKSNTEIYLFFSSLYDFASHYFGTGHVDDQWANDIVFRTRHLPKN